MPVPEVGDTVRIQMSPKGDMIRYIFSVTGEYEDQGADGPYVSGKVKSVFRAMIEIYCERPNLPKFPDGMWVNLPGKSHWLYTENLYDLPGFCEIISGSSSICECGKDKCGDIGLHSDWCPKYRM